MRGCSLRVHQTTPEIALIFLRAMYYVPVFAQFSFVSITAAPSPPPLFRYASRDSLEHFHDGEVPPAVNDERLERHRDHDLYGRRGTRRHSSAKRGGTR